MSQAKPPGAAGSVVDPRPVPPPAPDAGECCGEGCAHCVLDLHDAAMQRHEAALAAWQARQARAG